MKLVSHILGALIVPACVVSALALSCGACGKDKAREAQLRRSSGKAAVVIVGASQAPGSLIKEVEPNNEGAEAQALLIGGGVRGSLEGSSDIDRYRIATEEEGMLFIQLDGAADADLKLELQSPEGETLARSDRGPAATAEGVAGYWIDAKKSYQVVVSEFTKKKKRRAGGRQGPSASYRLQVSLRTSPEQGFELENNQDLEGAMEVSAGEERYGYIGWAEDSDWWRMPVTGFSEVVAGTPEAGQAVRRPALDISVSGMARVTTRLELVDALGEPVASRRSAPGQEVAIRSFVPEVGAEFYMIKVQAKRSNPEENYVLRVVDAELSLGQEEEPNDELAQATPLGHEVGGHGQAMPLGGEVGELILASGELCLGDVDMFSLSPASVNRVMDLRLDGPRDADLDVTVIAESGAILAESEQGGVGVSETLQAVDVPPDSAPVIAVRVKKLRMPAAYKLSLSLVEGRGIAQAPSLTPSENPDLEE